MYAFCCQELVKKIESVVKYGNEEEKGETTCKDTKNNPCSVHAINPVAISRGCLFPVRNQPKDSNVRRVEFDCGESVE